MSITISQLSYIHPDKEPLFNNINLSLDNGCKAGLVGDNGSGKSTLLQITAGRLSPSAGTISTDGGVYYVPQHFGQYNKMTIAEAMQVQTKLDALQAILKGEVNEDYFTILNDEWNIEEMAEASLSYWGLEGFQLSQSLSTLSGGEKTKVFLAGMQLQSSSNLILDEPTNHLDYRYREKLYRFVETNRSAMLVVSHDRTLLNLMPSICELRRNGAFIYGGNYEFYKEQKDLQQQALMQTLEEKEKQFRIARQVARETAERQQKHSSRGEKRNQKKGVSRIAMGNLKRHSENTAAKLKDIHSDKAEAIQQEIRKIKNSVLPTKVLQTDFNSSSLHTGKILVAFNEVNFTYHKDYLWKDKINCVIRSGERICINGKNGSGKTTFIKLITGDLIPTTGDIKKAEKLGYVYMDQEYSIINNNFTVLQQAMAYNNPLLPEHEIKMILNRFLFPSETWEKPCSKLSGGEKMRLAFCCLMINNNKPDLFILDEPTNNLDIQSIEIITETVKKYTGTVLVISHDRYFLKEIGVEVEIDLE